VEVVMEVAEVGAKVREVNEEAAREAA